MPRLDGLGALVPGALLAAALAVAMYLYGAPVVGPFILLDELEYFTYGRDIYLGASLVHHTQYGPVFPAVIAAFFHFGDEEWVYHAMRLFNIAILACCIVPAFLLARSLFPAQRALHALFPAVAVTTPFTGVGYAVWADPLYYALFLASLASLAAYARAPSVGRGIASGVLVALLFHTKSGAGLIAEAAAVAAAAVVFLGPREPGRPREWPAVAALVLTVTAITLPGAIRNLSLGVGLIGYSSDATVANRIAEVGRTQLMLEAFSSAFYQLAYLFLASWGMLAAAIAIPLLAWDWLSREQRAAAVFLGVYMVGLILISAVGMASYSGLAYWMPNGRYLTIMVPAAILMGLGMLGALPPAPLTRTAVAALGVLLAVLLARATPLYMLAPYAFVADTEMALVHTWIDHGTVVWRRMYQPSTAQAVLLATVFGALAVAWALIARRRALVAVAAVLVAYNIAVSVAAHRFIHSLGMGQRDLHLAVRQLARIHAAPYRDVAFDVKQRGSNMGNYVRFFYGGDGTLRYASTDEAAALAHASEGPRYFVSGEALPYPVAYRTASIVVYSLRGP